MWIGIVPSAGGLSQTEQSFISPFMPEQNPTVPCTDGLI